MKPYFASYAPGAGTLTPSGNLFFSLPVSENAGADTM
jgi:hypothetical protein